MAHSAPPLDRVAGQARNARRPVDVLRDYVALTKPSINRMCLLMTAGGLALAPNAVDGWRFVWALVGTALAVASANALNMWWERDSDRLMKRTQDRPLAAARISDNGALVFGIAIGALSFVVLALGTNALTTALGVFALVSYVLVYTPLKYRSPLALVVGAIPGAVPPLMGWTAATGTLDPAGAVLFATLLVWQMPHFIAIAMFRKHDYADAGIRVVTVVRGNRVAKWQAIAWATALLPISVLLTPLGVTGWIYASTAAVAGAVFLGMAIRGLTAPSDNRWARRLFITSLIYLPVLVAGLITDVALS